MTCILNEYNRNGCGNCADICGYKIAIQGLDGNGGRIASANVPKKYRHLTVSTSPAREDQAEVYAKISAYIQTFKGSLYLFSAATGTGKTTSASAILNDYIIRDYLSALKDGKQPSQKPAYFLDVNEWQTLYNGFNRKGIPQDIAEQYSRPYYAQMENAKHAPFAVLDDIGIRDASIAFSSDLHTVINYRVANELPTVYTSNVPLINATKPTDRIEANKPYDMLDVFGVRLLDRMRENCEVLTFEGRSKRGGKR